MSTHYMCFEEKKRGGKTTTKINKIKPSIDVFVLSEDSYQPVHESVLIK